MRFWLVVGCLTSLFLSNIYAFSLKEGLQIALENDKDIQAKNNAMEIILDEIRNAEGLNYPTIDFTSNVQKERLTGSRISANDYNRKAYDWEFIFRQPLYDGHDAHYEEKLQRERYESAKYFMLDGANALALQYIEAYLNVLREKALLEFSKESLTINQEIFAKNQLKFEKGFATRLEFERSQAKLNESLANHASQIMNFEESLITLRNFIQFDVDASSLNYPSLNITVPQSLEKARQEAFEIHPSIKTSDINIQVALNEYKRDQKRFHPKLDLVARYGGGDEVPGLEQPTNEYSVGLEVRYNLYNGGKDIAANNKAQKYIDEKRILSERARQQIENRLRLAWNAYTLNERKLPQMRSYTDSKKAVLETTMIEYDLGTADLNLLLTTQDEYIVSKKSLIATQRDLLLSKYRIREAIGDVVERIMLAEESPISIGQIKNQGIANEVEEILHVKPKYTHLEPELLKWNHELQPDQQSQYCYKTKSKSLNIRQNPTKNSAIVAQSTRGEKMCGNEWNGSWLKVSQGWVNSEYLEHFVDEKAQSFLAKQEINNLENNQRIMESEKDLSSKQPNNHCYAILSKVLNVRKEPNAQSQIVTRYTKNQSVCGTDWKGMWLKTSAGWISATYLQPIKTYASNNLN